MEPNEQLGGQVKELEALLDAFTGIVNRLAVTVRFMERPMFMAQLCEAVGRGIARHQSPWLDPAGAADYSFSSEGFVYAMAGAGVIKRYGGENMPRFLKSEIDAAIREGRWQKAKAKSQGLNAKTEIKEMEAAGG